MREYLQYAADTVRRHAASLRAAGDRAPSVLIFGRIGDSTHPRCYADLLDGGQLVVVSVDNQAMQAIYMPGMWREASVYDADGNLLYVLTPQQAAFPVQRACSMCGRPAWFICQREDGSQEFRCPVEHITLTTTIETSERQRA